MRKHAKKHVDVKHLKNDHTTLRFLKGLIIGIALGVVFILLPILSVKQTLTDSQNKLAEANGKLEQIAKEKEGLISINEYCNCKPEGLMCMDIGVPEKKK